MSFFHGFMPWQSDIEILCILAPVVLGGLFYLLQFTLKILGFKRDAFYDPAPVRFWFIVACFNLVFAGIWSLEYEMIPWNVSAVLFAFIPFLYQNCRPDFYYSGLDQWA